MRWVGPAGRTKQQYLLLLRLVRLHEQLEAMGRNVSQLPNWAYGVALAHFYLASEDEERGGDGGKAGGKPSSAEAREEHAKKADRLLQSALLMFPSVLLHLLDKCSVEASDEVTKHKYFLEAHIG